MSILLQKISFHSKTVLMGKILFLTITLVHLENIYAGLRGDWVGNYYGNPSFDLEDDPSFGQAREEVRRERRRLKRLEENLRPLQRKLKQKKGEQGEKKQRVQKLGREIDQLQNRMEKARAQLPQWERQLDELPRQLNSLRQERESKKREVSRLDRFVKDAQAKAGAAHERAVAAKRECMATTGQTKEQCNNAPEVVAAFNKHRELNRERRRLEGAQANALSALSRLKEQISQTQGKINQTQQKIAQAREVLSKGVHQLAQKERKKSELNGQLAQLQREVRDIQEDLSSVRSKVKNQEYYLEDARRRARRVRQNLISQILEANREGFQEGRREGERQGSYLAQKWGDLEGKKDGQREGQEQGRTQGKKREYENGYKEGELLGEKKAREQGQKDGMALGYQQGNSMAGSREGKQDGLKRAVESDAALVGEDQGTRDGMTRAQTDGRRQGEAQGRKQAIEQYEGQTLERVSREGPFAGTFSQQIPPYPGAPRPDGQYCRWKTRRLAFLACEDGLTHSYDQTARRTYHQEIVPSYNNAYQAAHSAAYRQAFNLHYKEDYLEGKNAGQAHQFAQHYPSLKERFRVQEQEKYSSHPQRKSAPYQQSFNVATNAAYQEKYEEIRTQHFQRTSQETYGEHIAAQVEKFTQSKFQEVSHIYQNYSIVSYEGFHLRDGGIRGVGAGDGIYQPEEKVIYDITLKNYGHQPAHSVSVVLNSGERVTLPELPPRSWVTVKGAITSQVSASAGQQERTGVSTMKELQSSYPALEGRHFFNPISGQINEEDSKDFPVSYPFSLKNISVEGELLWNQETNYQLEVENHSQRSYSGPITIQVRTSLGPSILTSTPNPIGELQPRRKTIHGGELLVNKKEDALQYLSFDIDLIKEGVLVGQIRDAGKKLIQVPYRENGNGNEWVALGDAQLDPQSLLQTLSLLGGLEQVSILDLSLPYNTPAVLKRAGALTGKTLTLAREEIDLEMKKALQQAMTSSPYLLVATHIHQTDQHDSVMALEMMKSSLSQEILLGKSTPQTLTFVNEYSTTAAKGVIVTKFEDLEDLEEIKQTLLPLLQDHEKLTSQALDSLTEEKVSQIFKTQVLKPQERMPLQALLLNIVLDALKANEFLQTLDKQQGKRWAKKTAQDPNFFFRRVIKKCEQALKAKDKTKIISGIVMLKELHSLLTEHPKLTSLNRVVKKEFLIRPQKRILTKLMKQLKSTVGREFFQTFNEHIKTSPFGGSFRPLK